MPSFNFLVESNVPESPRVKQLSGMFDVPIQDKLSKKWEVDLPVEDFDWKVGLIAGPSGCGKSQIARRVWGDAVDRELDWSDRPVIDEFPEDLSVTEITDACSAVGFNTIPSWMKPYGVLSNGERFRVELARRLLSHDDPVVVDEFTSVVDRQVAKIASHACQNYVRRKSGRRFVAVTCHYDVIDWLQPDWVYDPSTGEFARRSVQPRPSLNVAVSPVPYSAWRLFAPYHYLTQSLAPAARCWGLWVEDHLAAFCAAMFRPSNAKAKKHRGVMGLSRTVTLPDFQGLGLGYFISDTVASIYTGLGYRVNSYPAHPGMIRVRDRSPNWKLIKKPASFSAESQSLDKLKKRVQGQTLSAGGWMARMGSRPNATFRYVGPPMDRDKAEAMARWHRDVQALRSGRSPRRSAGEDAGRRSRDVAAA